MRQLEPYAHTTFPRHNVRGGADEFDDKLSEPAVAVVVDQENIHSLVCRLRHLSFGSQDRFSDKLIVVAVMEVKGFSLTH